MWTNVCLGFNRLIAIFFPHNYSFVGGKKFNGTLVVSSWAISPGLVLPIPFLEGGRVYYASRGLCLNYQTTNRKSNLLFMLFSVVPYALISTASVAVIFKSVRIYKNRQQQVRGNGGRDGKEFKLFSRRLHVARRLFFSFVWSSMCQLPVFLVASFFPDWLFESPVKSSWLNFTIALKYVGNPVSMPNRCHVAIIEPGKYNSRNASI
ncbi:hypothetical protein RvY_06331 [Ramazzottius varieornatus]|uniref:G-protein coupled receptors family 1 profile domain-containing protein n=1 Tax=Ramazzottius varieornatus TaxID=947166 RepID=A0A1D1UY77_RAMVA|nr:hypothetical protein RvY_06331 [Ramazzottius varieornatus]